MTGAIDLSDVTPGFADPVFDSQAVFRLILEAMSHPGRIVDLGVSLAPPVPRFLAGAAIALTMLDFETAVYVDPALGGAALGHWLRFHCNCPLVEVCAHAAFAFVSAATLPLLSAFHQGDPKYPDRSTTIVVNCDALSGGIVQTLAGPGIAGSIAVAPQGLPADFWAQLKAQRDAFPLGVDVILASEGRIIGLPRSIRLVAGEQ